MSTASTLLFITTLFVVRKNESAIAEREIISRKQDSTSPNTPHSNSPRVIDFVSFVQKEAGFRSFIAHLTKEFSVESMLFIVEVEQFRSILWKYIELKGWSTKNIKQKPSLFNFTRKLDHKTKLNNKSRTSFEFPQRNVEELKTTMHISDDEDGLGTPITPSDEEDDERQLNEVLENQITTELELKANSCPNVTIVFSEDIEVKTKPRDTFLMLKSQNSTECNIPLNEKEKLFDAISHQLPPNSHPTSLHQMESDDITSPSEASPGKCKHHPRMSFPPPENRGTSAGSSASIAETPKLESSPQPVTPVTPEDDLNTEQQLRTPMSEWKKKGVLLETKEKENRRQLSVHDVIEKKVDKVCQKRTGKRIQKKRSPNNQSPSLSFTTSKNQRLKHEGVYRASEKISLPQKVDVNPENSIQVKIGRHVKANSTTILSRVFSKLKSQEIGSRPSLSPEIPNEKSKPKKKRDLIWDRHRPRFSGVMREFVDAANGTIPSSTLSPLKDSGTHSKQGTMSVGTGEHITIAEILGNHQRVPTNTNTRSPQHAPMLPPLGANSLKASSSFTGSNNVIHFDNILEVTWLPKQRIFEERPIFPFKIGLYLCEKYIKPQGVTQINIPYETRKKILNFYEKYKDNANFNFTKNETNLLIELYHSFDQAEGQIWSLLRTDSYVRFSCTDEFKNVKESIMSKDQKYKPHKKPVK